MQTYFSRNLAQKLEAKHLGDSNIAIDKIWVDSRQITRGEGAIFVALQGAQDGHQFVEDAYQKGVRVFLVQKVENQQKDAVYLVVSDVLKALQKWAKIHREQFSYSVIGITGSNGKTIIKEWLYQILHQQFHIIRSPKSYNSQIGVPLSVLEMEAHHNLAIFEIGISEPGEMSVLEEIVQPGIGLLTNIGDAHTAFFESKTQHIQEKLKLFRGVEILICPQQEDILAELQKSKPKMFCTFGASKKSNFRLVSAQSDKNSTDISVEIGSQKKHFQIPFSDEVSIVNSLAVYAICQLLPINIDEVLPHFSRLKAVEMRMEIKEGIHQSLIINDCFNADLVSVPKALSLLHQQNQQHKTLILSGIQQTQKRGKALYQEVAEMVNAYDFDQLILIGKEIGKYADLFELKSIKYADATDFLADLDPINIQGHAILIKGARKYQLERISERLEKQSHETVLEVNLEYLIENVNYFKQLLQPQTQLMCMVKASGYGTGKVDIAQTLVPHYADYLGVAYADEGVELRNAGINTPIMVMNPEQNSYGAIIRHELEPEIYSLRILDLFLDKLKSFPDKSPYPVHIKLNTGMNRLGFKKEHLARLIEKLNQNPQLKVKSIFSHLSVSDVSEERDFTLTQIKKYQEMYAEISEGIGAKPIRHILNSSGILNYTDYQMDMVRIGIGMYGQTTDEKHQKYLKDVVTFKTVISQINELEKGESISYGRRFKADKNIRVATLPVGYADGVKRALSNGVGEVSIRGKRATILGSICMDMMMVDISDIDCEEGDEVVLFGEELSIKEVANWAQTITYEILTSIAPRVKRVYLR